MLATIITAVIGGLFAGGWFLWRAKQAEQDKLDAAGLKGHEAAEAQRVDAERSAKEAAENAKREAGKNPLDW